MKFRRVRNQTPQSSPPRSLADGGNAEDERFVWEVLVPRLLYPSRLALIQALLQHGRPLGLSELADAAEITIEHARYHCKAMQAAGVLEVTGRDSLRPNEAGDEPSYYFPKPSQAAHPSRPAA